MEKCIYQAYKKDRYSIQSNRISQIDINNPHLYLIPLPPKQIITITSKEKQSYFMKSYHSSNPGIFINFPQFCTLPQVKYTLFESLSYIFILDIIMILKTDDRDFILVFFLKVLLTILPFGFRLNVFLIQLLSLIKVFIFPRQFILFKLLFNKTLIRKVIPEIRTAFRLYRIFIFTQAFRILIIFDTLIRNSHLMYMTIC